MKFRILTCLGTVVATTLFGLLTACNDEVDREAAESYRISPSAATLSADDATLLLTVEGGHPPFRWSVSDGTLGTVTGIAEVVTYTRAAKNGANIVEVRDNRDWLASVLITQTDQEQADVAVSPSSAKLSENSDTLVLIGTGKEPFTWQVADKNRGRLNATSGRSTIYTRKASGDNSVVLRDADGNVAVAKIEQPHQETESPAALSVSATPNNLATNGALSAVSVSGGTPPYSWSLVEDSIGTILSTASQGSSGIYRRDAAGDNAIIIEDDQGIQVAIVIQQP